MQDTIFNFFNPNQAEVNDTVSTSVLPNAAIISRFEESLRVRLEGFALDAHEVLTYSLNHNLATLQEHLELQQNQLDYLINDLRLLQWLTDKREAQKD
jgi:uncharacterized coiled-coil protein SlyX